MKNKGHPSNNFQNYKKINNSHKFCQKNYNSGQFPAGTLPFQASQQIKAVDDILMSVNIINCFLSKIGEKYYLTKEVKHPILCSQVTRPCGK